MEQDRLRREGLKSALYLKKRKVFILAKRGMLLAF